jgi:hypothetical protein
MRSPLIPVLVVIAGLALAWLWWTRESDAPSRAVTAVATENRKPASSTVPVSATPTADVSSAAAATAPASVATNAPTATAAPAQPAVSDPARPLSSRESAVSSTDDAHRANAAEEDGASTSGESTTANASPSDPSIAETADDSAASTTESPSDAATGDERTSGDDEAKTDDAAKESTDAPESDGDRKAPEGSDASKSDLPPLDAAWGADSIADMLAHQDAAAADGIADDNVVGKAAQAFEHEATDPAWAGSTRQLIESSLNAWRDAQPENIRDHMRLAHVECRLAYCQVLAFENTPTQQWSNAFRALHDQPWWNELRFKDENSEAAHDIHGYTMYQAYFVRDTTPGG